MTAKEYNDKIVAKCKKCKSYVYCKKHQQMWFKVVEQSPRPLVVDSDTRKFLDALNGIAAKVTNEMS